MRKVLSSQRNVQFLFCPSPITIDKRAEWGDKADNLQYAPNGAFLKTSSPTQVSHLVQPNDDKTAPVGWMPGSAPGFFDKLPIWIDDKNVLQPGAVKTLKTADGEIVYTAKEVSMVCYNDLNNAPNVADVWVQTVAAIEKNYVL